MSLLPSRFIALLAALIAVLLVAACSGDDEPAARDADGHNSQDVMFSMMMIPHHRQAVEMADMVPGRDASPELVTLAKQIKAAQQPEIDKMTEWLESWGQNVPPPNSSMGDHAGHGGMGGMMTDEQMDQLAAAQGAQFETMWLQMMIEHHEGAVVMAEDEVAGGKFPATVEMAEEIVASQKAEIEQMKEMLAG